MRGQGAGCRGPRDEGGFSIRRIRAVGGVSGIIRKIGLSPSRELADAAFRRYRLKTPEFRAGRVLGRDVAWRGTAGAPGGVAGSTSHRVFRASTLGERGEADADTRRRFFAPFFPIASPLPAPRPQGRMSGPAPATASPLRGGGHAPLPTGHCWAGKAMRPRGPNGCEIAFPDSSAAFFFAPAGYRRRPRRLRKPSERREDAPRNRT